MRVDSIMTVVAIALAFAGAALVVRVCYTFIRRLENALDTVSAEDRAAVHARALQLGRALALLAYAVAALAAVSLALDRLDIGEPRWRPQQMVGWLLTHGVNIVIIVIGAAVVVRAANLAVEHLQHKVGPTLGADVERQRRARTLGVILSSLINAAVVFIAILMLLRELSIDIVPILTGAGIAGLAIGFGAQNLVRDVISGFFLILEDQVRIGDLARINGIGGTIEQINLRTIVLRDADGAVQVFPNGTITALANLSKQFAYAIVEVRIAYGENFDRVAGTLTEIGAAMEQDAVWGAVVVAPLEILGIQSLADGAATVQMKFKTLPFSQAKVANELRRRVMTAFVARGIRPYGG